jgi:hypothetical protein
MQPVEALRRTIDRARGAGDGRSIDPDDIEEKKDQEALGICEAFFEAALPVARFQCMVTIEGIGPKSKLGLGDYTVCGLTIPAIKNALIGLSMEKVSVYVRLWERHQQGSEMLSGYQGQTKCLQFRNWLADIDRWEAERARPELEVGRGPQG